MLAGTRSHWPARAASAAAALALAGGLVVAGAVSAGAHPRAGAGQTLAVVLRGADLTHTFTPAGATATVTEPLTKPDDLTRDGRRIFVAFANGVGAQGEPSASGNTDSTVVELSAGGKVLGQWDIAGKCDGLGADPARHRVVATVDEDGNSSLYTIAEEGGAIRHYRYDANPLPHNGGTDAVSVWGDELVVSASAPGTTGAGAPQAAYPALYQVGLDATTLVAHVTPLFSDEATATIADAGPQQGTPQTLALTDPDSNAVVPGVSPRFAGDFELTSQGDSEQIYTPDPLSSSPELSVLTLTEGGQLASVDDTAWATRHGTLLFTDGAHNTIDAFTGSFRPGTAYVSVTPCGLNAAPATCPGPGYPANFLGTLNLATGAISPAGLGTIGGVQPVPQGLLFVPGETTGGEEG
jgi:hypothetical protein